MAAREDGPVIVRALTVGDVAAWDAARGLLDAVAAQTTVDLARYHLDVAARGETDEALVCGAFVNDRLCGLVLYGLVAGTIGTGRLMFVAAAADHRRRGVGRALVEAALADLARRGARFTFTELPASMQAAAMLLQGLGFREETRVGGYFADGVDLRFLRREAL